MIDDKDWDRCVGEPPGELVGMAHDGDAVVAAYDCGFIELIAADGAK